MKIARVTYAASAWVFVAGVTVQVFFAGMSVLANRWGWDNHIMLGHTLAAPLLLMLVAMYAGRMPGRMKRLTWLLFGAYVLQADVLIFLRASAPVLSALHPVMALLDFALGLHLAVRASALVSTDADLETVRFQPDTLSGD